jgi:hypothetical protein
LKRLPFGFAAFWTLLTVVSSFIFKISENVKIFYHKTNAIGG